MDDYAGRVLADRYRLPLPPSDEYELAETRAFDTYSGQEVLVRQVPLPEVVDAEVVDAEGTAAPRRAPGRTQRRATDPAVRRAIEAAQSAARIPDHPRLDQVFDVFAEAGSLWIVSELVAARPLAALLAEKPLNPFRAAEIASDVLTAVRVLHGHGWTHRNITVRTVLVCDDGRVVLTGLAAGAAEEALCGYAPVPEPYAPELPAAPGVPVGGPGQREGQERQEYLGPPERPQQSEQLPPPEAGPALPYDPGPTAGVPGAPGRAALGPYDTSSSGTSGAMPRTNQGPPGIPAPYGGRPGLPGASASGDIRAARAGAIAAYRAGARAAARASEDERSGGSALPPLPEPGTGEAPPETAAGTGQPTAPGAAGPAQGGGSDPDWWAQPPHTFEGADPDSDEDDDPPAPYRAQLAGTWRDGPAPWNDASGSVPAGGGSGGSGGDGGSGGSPYGPDSDGPFGAGPARGDRPALPPAGAGGSGPSGGSGTGAAMARGGDAPYAGPGSGSGGGSGSWQASGGRDALRADAQRHAARLPAVVAQGAGRWDEVVASGSVPAYRGPATPLAAERARQARIAVVGAVTERWAPEQAGPVHDNWQLAPPIGPSTDLWALGALLYRAVQGHAPYPEESAAELVQLVCAEPPAFAEECGPLRPVVESLLRQDPTERPDFEELRGWLRSLVRSAPEPEAGTDVVPLPAVDATRLPIKRRRGELVRRRRGRNRDLGRHRHKKGKERAERDDGRVGFIEQQYEQQRFDQQQYGQRQYEQPQQHQYPSQHPYQREAEEPGYERYERPGQGGGRRGRSLGRTLLILILLLLVAGVVYAVMFMPKSGTDERGQSVGEAGPSTSAAPQSPAPQKSGTSAPQTSVPGTSTPGTSGPAVDLAPGYALRKDPEGFQIGVDKGWQRRPINDSGQVRYVGGDFTLIVVPGRDAVAQNGDDPVAYQRDKERELQPFRDSSWSSASGVRRIDVGRQAMAEGQFTWQDSSGREVFVRNLAMIIDGRYHVIQVIGPDSQRDKVSEIYQQATQAYRVTG
ncbi:protein kinase [Streptomyces sp. NPDC051569]|uniref:protein kinase n=1 Tax=Streptomyces sp. NPDC051569 TaxID=3365661 RepID=UPI0037ACE406